MTEVTYTFARLNRMRMMNNELDSFPAELSYLNALSTIYMNYNSLTNVKGIGGLKALGEMFARSACDKYREFYPPYGQQLVCHSR